MSLSLCSSSLTPTVSKLSCLWLPCDFCCQSLDHAAFQGASLKLATVGDSKSFAQDKSTVRTFPQSPHSQIQLVLATDIQGFILTLLLTCNVTLQPLQPTKSLHFYYEGSQAESTASEHVQKHLSPCRPYLASTLSLPVSAHKPGSEVFLSHAMWHHQLPIICRRRMEKSCTLLPVSNWES